MYYSMAAHLLASSILHSASRGLSLHADPRYVQNYYRAGFERYINVLNEIVQHSKYLFSENNILAMTIIILFVETSTAQTLNRGHGKS